MNKTSKGLAIASMIMGILAILLFSTILFAIIFGSLAVIFAILSKGAVRKFSPFARTGFVTGGLSIVIAFAIIIGFYVNVANNAEFRQTFNESYERQYGITFDEYIELVGDALVNGDEESMDKLYEVIY